MSENASLADVIQHAISGWCGDNDKSMLTNFIFVGEFIENNGENSTAVVFPPSASVPSTLGLSTYALNTFTELQRRDLMEVIYVDLDDDEE